MPELHVPTILKLTTLAVNGFADLVEAMPEDRQGWSPTDETRNARDMVHEVAESAHWFAEAMESGNSQFLSWEYWKPKLSERAPTDHSIGDLVAKMRAAHKRFAACYVGKDSNWLDTPIPGSEWSPTPRSVSYYLARNIWYHAGQVNYIQTCYGDFE